MLKISIVDVRAQRRLVIEGKLIAPWADELRRAWEQAKAGLNGRELVVEVKDLTAINQAGENILLEFMKHGVNLRGYGVFTRHLLRQLARQASQN
ncbi:MAG TPA: hypothetical protein VKZ53_18745 [Candidatus Angelobacter sp.]|nr:hypothetical protein [Candidatus Angelobacter sp.]